MEKGDRLLLYTDGITERFNIDDEQYGEKRFRNGLISVYWKIVQEWLFFP